MIVTGRSRNIKAMSLLRELFWVCAVHDIDLRVRHIGTEVNIRADRLSRLHSNPTKVCCFGLPIKFSSCCIHSEVKESTSEV